MVCSNDAEDKKEDSWAAATGNKKVTKKSIIERKKNLMFMCNIGKNKKVNYFLLFITESVYSK